MLAAEVGGVEQAPGDVHEACRSASSWGDVAPLTGVGAAVVALHGASSTRSAVLDQAVVLARPGYGVLLFDARGMGRSGGRAMDFRLVRRGGPVGGLAADHRLRAVAAEGASNRVAGDWALLSDAFGVRGLIQRGLFWLTYHGTDALASASPPRTLRRAVVDAAPRPVLLLAVGKVAEEQCAGRFIRSASPASVDLWVVAGAVHIGGLASQPAEWQRRVIEFFDVALRA